MTTLLPMCTPVYAAQHHGIAGDPDIVADVDLVRILCHGGPPFGIHAHALLCNERMSGGHQRYIGPEADIVADVHPGIVHDW